MIIDYSSIMGKIITKISETNTLIIDKLISFNTRQKLYCIVGTAPKGCQDLFDQEQNLYFLSPFPYKWKSRHIRCICLLCPYSVQASAEPNERILSK